MAMINIMGLQILGLKLGILSFDHYNNIIHLEKGY